MTNPPPRLIASAYVGGLVQNGLCKRGFSKYQLNFIRICFLNPPKELFGYFREIEIEIMTIWDGLRSNIGNFDVTHRIVIRFSSGQSLAFSRVNCWIIA